MTAAISTQSPNLNDWLPDSVVVLDLKEIINSTHDRRVELDSGTITIPPETNYEIVSKSWREVRFDLGFGNCYRILVAVGGVSKIESGIIHAVHCFCTLWYSGERKLITTDFSIELPM